MATAGSPAQRRAEFIESVAPGLADQVADGTSPWTADVTLSTFFGWFDTGDVLIVVGCAGETQRDLDLGLAYGLGHAQDRELIIILPAGFEEPTRQRLPWLDTAIRLFAHDNTSVTPVAPLSRHEVLAARDDELVTAVHGLGDRAIWMDRLVGWADSCSELVAAHRSSYLAWHCRGRMVLKIRTTSGALIASAGVHSSVDDSQLHTETITAPINPEQFHRIVAAVSHAAAERLGGADAANAEHELQERLARMKSVLRLPVMLREFPAIRPVNHRGYIDFLAVGHDKALHIVETKIGADPMLALQGLDYWIWATAHRKDLAAYLNDELDVDIGEMPPVVIDFMVAEKKGVSLSPYTAAQLEAIDASVPWTVHHISGWDTVDAKVHSPGRRRPPAGPRCTEPTFPDRLTGELIARAQAPLTRQVFFAEPGAGIIELAKAALDELRTRQALHRFIDHVQSSQAFALNVFGGVSDDEQHSIWQLLGVDAAKLDGVEFEYIDGPDALAEAQPARPHQTQVDVLLRCEAATGQRHVALIEVKLSETGFGRCSAFEAAGNDRRDVCRNDGAWGGNTDACFQLRNHDGPHRRNYDRHLQPESVRPVGVGCPFRELNQAMRNIALARAIIERGDADVAAFALCAPTSNTIMWRQWAHTQQVFVDVPGVALVALPAESLAEALSPERIAMLSARYGFFERPN